MRIALTLALAATAAACGPGPALYEAEPAPSATVVDGDAGEWPSALRPVPDEAGLGLGLRRDGDALVLVVVASDERQARRIALGGLRVWIDPEGGTDRALGLRYPSPGVVEPGELRRQAAARRAGTAGPDPDRLRRRFESGLAEVEVTRGAVTQRANPDGRFGGLKAAAEWDARALVVEMRVPLTPAQGLLAEAPGDALGVGFELLDVRRRAAPGPRRVAGPRRPDPDGVPAARTEPNGADVQTVTRWVRIDL